MSIQPLETELKPLFSEIDIQKENKTRKQWLIALFMYIPVTAYLLFFITLTNPLFYELTSGLSTQGMFLAVLLVQLPNLLWFWITYHYAYKKRGTKLLMFILIAIALKELLSFSKGEWTILFDLTAFEVLFFTILLSIKIFYWISCLQLYLVNSSRKKAFKQKSTSPINV